MLSSVVKSKRSGFTLIELLVVTAHIAILAALLFPVFAKAREKARQTSCLSQTKQLGLAFIQYYQDYDEKLPAGSISTVNTNDKAGAGWAGQIYPQVKSASIYKCPDDSTTNATTQINNVVQVPLSYGFNVNAAGQTQALYNNVAKSVLLFETVGNQADVTNIGNSATPSGDVNSWAANGITGINQTYNPGGPTNGTGQVTYATGYMAGSGATATGPGQGQFATATGRHSDGSNFLMADGHSKWFRGSAVSAGNSNATNNDCGPAATTFAPTSTTATAGMAANSGCSDPRMAATFSVN